MSSPTPPNQIATPSPATTPSVASERSVPPAPATPAAGEDDADHAHAITELLQAWRAGDTEASETLARLVYTELRRQARFVLRRESVGESHTLQVTGLVHEAWLRLDAQHDTQWQSRTQFFAVAAQMMRRVLVDYARTRRALKRGGDAAQVTLGAVDREGAALDPRWSQESALDPEDLLALDDALARLAALDPQKARIVELRYFAGLDIGEVADALGISPATVGRQWTVARMWLRRELER